DAQCRPWRAPAPARRRRPHRGGSGARRDRTPAWPRRAARTRAARRGAAWAREAETAPPPSGRASSRPAAGPRATNAMPRAHRMRRASDHTDRAVHLEHREVHVLGPLEAMLADGLADELARDIALGQVLLDELPIMN